MLPSTQWAPSAPSATRDRLASMWARSASDGSVPWLRHTTIGVAQISQSAIQQMSSSWCHGVMRAASHSGQSGSVVRSVTAARLRRPGPATDAATVEPMSDSLGPAGSGYAVVPHGGSGPGVLVLHAWWGLTPFFRSVCDRLADEGFVALAPDLHGGGRVAETPDEAEAVLAATDPNRTANLVVASMAALRAMPATPDGRVGILGYSMGASWAFWAATRFPDDVAAVVAFYGSQDIDFAPARAAFQGHFAEIDEFESDDDVNYLEAQLRLAGHDVDFHRYPGTGHWFAESDRPAAYVDHAAETAWARTVAFLHAHLDPPPDPT
jgi:carboxymethylenebutenolidase